MTLEEVELAKIAEVMPDKRVRPSALAPLGQVFGFASAAATAVLGKEYSKVLLSATESAIMVRVNHSEDGHRSKSMSN